MAEFIGLEVTGLEALTDFLLNLDAHMIDIASDAMLEYYRKALRNPANYSPYKHVTRAAAYPNAPAGPGWFSDKQRKYVMAAIRRGEIKIGNNRTGNLAKSWKKEGYGEKAFLYNDAPYASYVVSPDGQSNHERLVGWQTGDVFMAYRTKEAEQAATKAINNYVSKARK